MKKRHLLMLKRWCVNSNPKSKSKRIFLAQDIEFIWFLSDCVMNVLSGVVPINKKELQQFEPQLRQLSEKYFSALERSKLFQTTRGHSLIQLIARPYRKMPTEEFVLIRRNMCTTEQPQVSQILNNPLTKNKSKQLSLLQRTSKQEPPEAVIQQNTEQQTDDVMVSDEEQKQQSIPDDNKRKEFDEISQSVIDDRFSRKRQIWKSKKNFEENQRITQHFTGR